MQTIRKVTMYRPTTAGADYIRTCLQVSNIKGRVAKQRESYRIVTDQVEEATAVLASAGFSNPTDTGAPVRCGLNQLFAYDFQNMGASA